MTTLSQLITGTTIGYGYYKAGATSEAAAIPVTTWYLTGYPPTGFIFTSSINGETLTGTSLSNITGMFLCPNPNDSNATKTYLTRWEIAASPAVAEFVLADRLWQNSAISVTTTTEQSITTPLWPERCPSATGGYENWNASGHNVMVAMEVRVATTQTAILTGVNVGGIKFRYTNSDGVSERIGSIPLAPATLTANTFLPFQLASGDKGVQSIQGLTIGTSLVAGVVHLVAYREIAKVGCPFNSQLQTLDALALGRPELPNGTVPFMYFIPSTTTAQNIYGRLEFSTN